MPKNKKNQQPQTTAAQLSAIVKACRDIMRKDKGLNGDVDRLPMLTWIMFLKFLDDMENQRETEAKLEGNKYSSAVRPPYRWRDWASKEDGITGEELISFINNQECVRPDGTRGPGLFAYLRSLEGTGTRRDRRNVIATVFRGTANRMLNGYLLRDVVNKINQIHFTSSDEIHTLSHLYESLLKEMQDAAGDAGEFYTPRPVVKFMVQVVNPRLGEVVLDPACGTGGFLVESFEHIKKQCKTIEDHKILQEETIFGGEAKSLPYLLSQMNLLLHGLDAPVIDPGNSLRHSLKEIGDKDRVDVILTNPPFGGEEEKGIQGNFPEDKQTAETALLFLQLIMRKLRRPGHLSKKGGRAGVVVPNGTLFGDGVCARIKEELLKEFNLHTIVRLPNGVFTPYTNIPTNLLFFDRSGPAKEIWYYEHPLPEGRKNYSKTKPIQFDEFKPCLEWWEKREENERAWKVKVEDILKYDEEHRLIAVNLDIRNPRTQNDYEHIPPVQLVEDILKSENNVFEKMQEIKALVLSLNEVFLKQKLRWSQAKISEICDSPQYGYTASAIYEPIGPRFLRITDIQNGEVNWENVPFCNCPNPAPYLLKKGDIVFARTGATTGKSFLIQDYPEAIFASYLIRLRVKRIVSAEYLYQFFQSPLYWEQINQGKEGTGQPNFNGTKLSDILVPIPPVEEQQRIVENITKHLKDLRDRINHIKIHQSKSADQLNALLPSILDKVLKGEL